MVQKRPLVDDEQICVSFKHPRQLEHSKELVSFSESVFPEDDTKKPQTLENGWATDNNEGEREETHSAEIFSDFSKGGEDVETTATQCLVNSPWTTNSTSEEDSLSESPFHGSFFPEYFHPERPIRPLAHSEDIYSFILDHSPRKSASIGPEHQADVPLWDAQGRNKHLHTSGTVSDLEDEKRLMGTCVIPMPDSDLTTVSDCIVGKGRTDCSCEDEGSGRCARQHIFEAREKLIKTIGPKRFEEIGFCDMGEQVAQTWSQEEEQLFHQVVFSNPVSLGRNFWDKLSTVFPSRTKKEIVSYYFNVFMLRKRAEQNRYDPTNVDSDNDEGRESSDYGENQLAVAEDEGSVVESPVCQDNPSHNQNWKSNEDVVDDTRDGNDFVDMFCGGTNRIWDGYFGVFDNCGSGHIAQLQDKTAWDARGDHEVEDDSCTSFDAAAAASSQGNQLKSENGNHWSGSFNRSSNRGENILEPCDTKIWDAGFTTYPKNNVDFSPTCNVIEEVFRKEP